MEQKKRYLTGMRITSDLHIGNYLGVVPLIRKLSQDSNADIFIFVADTHSVTNGPIKDNPYDLIKMWMYEFGHNPNIHFYLQSRFYEFAHFAWILSCNISVGELNRMTQFKSQEDKGAVHTGYLVYPVLMAADILLPSATHVPVGPDQMQHVELTRTIARTMNDRYNLNLTIPEPITDFSSKIMDLQNANCKMSKSNTSTKGTLFMCDDQMEQKISRAMTDSFAMPMNVEEIKDSRKEIYNLCNIYRLLNENEDFSKIEMDFGGRMTGTFKQSLFELVYNKLNPIKNFIENTSDQQAMQFLAKSELFVASEIQKTMNKINHKFFPYLP